MPLKGFMEAVKEKTEGLGDLAKGKLDAWLDEYKKAMAVLRRLGLRSKSLPLAWGFSRKSTPLSRGQSRTFTRNTQSRR